MNECESLGYITIPIKLNPIYSLSTSVKAPTSIGKCKISNGHKLSWQQLKTESTIPPDF